MIVSIPADYFYEGAPAQEWQVTKEGVDRYVENARKIFGPDVALDYVTEAEEQKPKQ